MSEEERVKHRLDVIHRAEVMQEIIDKYIGCIEAVIETIGRETLNTKRFEYSMKKSGEHAASVLKEIKSMINYILEESEEEWNLK